MKRLAKLFCKALVNQNKFGERKGNDGAKAPLGKW